MPGKYIDREWLEERLAIKLEHIRKPTPRQVHDAREECLREFRELYGEFEIVRWPEEQPLQP
jgi:hypothetical protein